jgi:hypothetical protein
VRVEENEGVLYFDVTRSSGAMDWVSVQLDTMPSSARHQDGDVMTAVRLHEVSRLTHLPTTYRPPLQTGPNWLLLGFILYRADLPNFDTCLISTPLPNYTKKGVEFRAGMCRNYALLL